MLDRICFIFFVQTQTKLSIFLDGIAGVSKIKTLSPQKFAEIEKKNICLKML